jgi:ubiquinone/menaquinone biosynthesis C-methylase UbiE
MLAQKYPRAHVAGVDYFGGSWGYGQQQCERNAQAEGVAARVAFSQASASALPFADGAFDLAVSNLVFHEVKDSADKRDVIKEALRVVKPGGAFVFQDLLKLTPYFGTPDELMALIKSWGVREVRFEDTGRTAFIPRALRLPFMVGALGMVYGVK